MYRCRIPVHRTCPRRAAQRLSGGFLRSGIFSAGKSRVRSGWHRAGARPGSFIARVPHGILRCFISKPPFHLYELHFHPIAADFGEKTKESTAALDKERFCTMIVVHTTMQIHLFEIRPGGCLWILPMKNEKNFRPDRVFSYFRVEWLPLAFVTLSGLIYNIGLLATSSPCWCRCRGSSSAFMSAALPTTSTAG